VVEIVPENGGFLDLWSILHLKNSLNAIHFLEPDRACKAGEFMAQIIELSCARLVKERRGKMYYIAFPGLQSTF